MSGIHGTLGRYSGGCRCADCRAARRAYDKEREQRLRPSRIQVMRQALDDAATWLEVEADHPRVDPRQAMRLQASLLRKAAHDPQGSRRALAANR